MIAVLSGKGGTGKTTVSIALAETLRKPLVGADVESPTTMIAYGDEVLRSEPVYRHKVVVDESCIGCYACLSACPFGAIIPLQGRVMIDEEACEGCLKCIKSCPMGALRSEKELVGELRYGHKVLLEGILRPGKKEARIVLEEVLRRAPKEAIIDGSPGASPNVYRIIRKADRVILVIEPNKPSIADARRVLTLLARHSKPTGIVVNKYGIGRIELIEELAKEFGVPIIGRIRYVRELMHKRPIEVPEILEDAQSIELEFEIPEAREEHLERLKEPEKAERLAEHITVVSGKGGTGKTLIAIGLAKYLGIPVVDADVDAPDSYVLMGYPRRLYGVEGKIYEIDPELCTGCGECMKACYNFSIEEHDGGYKISPELCEGCGMCLEVCPENAIRPKEIVLGRIGEGEAYFVGESSIGRAGIGELVYELKQIVSKRLDRFVLDGSPGSGCTTISAISGAKAVIIVVEPKPESLESAKRVAEIAKHFGVRRFVIVNKRSGESVNVEDIGELLGYVPYDEEVFEAYALGKRPEGSKAAEAIEKISSKLRLYLLGELEMKREQLA